MKRFFLKVFIVLVFFLVLSPSVTLATENPLSVPNNKFGIHILFPSELESAAKLVNSNGGDWGYVTIPIQSTDRDLDKWQKFMDDCKKYRLIPIIRLATYPENDYWTRPTVFDPLDFANFLNSLDWPTKNRYVIVYNEVNSNLEYEKAVDAAHYAQILNESIDAFKRVNPDFFVISAGLDPHAPSVGNLYENQYQFYIDMDQAVPGIFSKIDGLASHSYPAFDFSANPANETTTGSMEFKTESEFFKNRFGRANLPIFITETGWKVSDRLAEFVVANYYREAFTQKWNDPNIVAVTPFLLNGQASGFTSFSFIGSDNQPNLIYKTVASLPKIKGTPAVPASPAVASVSTFRPTKRMTGTNNDIGTLYIDPTVKAVLKWLIYPVSAQQ